MALRARYGPGNRAWSYQRPADDSANGPPPLPSAFGLTLSADEHTPAPETRIDPDAPTLTAADAARTANGAAKSRARSDGASAARAARSAKASAARNARASGGGQVAAATATATGDSDSAPRRRSGRVPATTARARGASPTHTAAAQRTVKRKRSTLASDAAAEAETESESASRPFRDGLLAPGNDDNTDAEQDPAAPRPARGAGSKRPRVSQKDLDVKLPRAGDADDTKRTTFGSTTTAPDPFTSLSATDLTSNQDQNAQPQSNFATTAENPHGTNSRRLPPGVPVHRYLAGLYRRYPVSQVGLPKEVITDVPDLDTNVALPPNTIPNAAPFLNLYAPRRTRGIGADKHGLCPICAEPPSRGGRGKAMMLNMKTSAFNYHMQYVHGLSPKTGLPFSPPIAFRSAPRKAVGAREKATLEEGLCHACARWIVVEGVKAVDVLVPEIYWWKHASTCHKSRMLDGEGDFYTEDPLFQRIVQWQRDHPTTTGRDITRTSNATANANGAGAGAVSNVASKDEPMEVDLLQPATTLPGAMTPVRLNQGDPDSSPLSSLDGTDGARISPVAGAHKASPLALSYPPSSRGPFGPPSPSAARARSAETAPALPHPTGANPFPLGTPQHVNHALPGTLPGTPQTTASVTPVIPGAALPAVGTSAPQEGTGTDSESRSVADSGVELSPRDQPTKTTEGEEGEDEDAEGEDDPTATAENTPVIPLLPVLAGLPPVEAAAEQPGTAPDGGEHASEQPAPHSSSADLGQGPTEQPVSSMLGVEPHVPVPEAPQEDVQMPDAPTVQPTPIASSITEQTPNPVAESQATMGPVTQEVLQQQEVPQQQMVDVPAVPALTSPVPLELSNMADMADIPVPAELPAIQGMDMYAGNATPNEGETSQLVLTEEDLALASSDLALVNGLAGPEMSLVGEEAGIPAGALDLPSDNLETAPVPSGQPAAANATLTNAQAVSGLSSGEGTPNAGGESDMFAFWNA